MKLLRWRYCIILAFIYLAINICSLAENHAQTSVPVSQIKLRGKVDIVASSCSAAGITLSSAVLPAGIDKIRLGSPAFYAGLAAGDKILSAQLNNNQLSLLIERHGQKFSAQLSTVPVNLQINDSSTPMLAGKDNKQPDKLMKASTGQIELQGNVACNKLADALIKKYDDPDNKELRSEINLLQREVQLQVESHGGQWHIAAYYSDKHKDPDFCFAKECVFTLSVTWKMQSVYLKRS